MPSSRPNTIPTVIHVVRQLQPQSILDVGVGFGKWGHLFREYTDIVGSERDLNRYQRENWRVKIDGIEGHSAYLTPMHRFLYNEIHVGNACELIKTLPAYDLIFLGDMIEHLQKQPGLQLLRDAWQRCNKAIIVTTPRHETRQGNLCGNELERHRSVWAAKDFREFPGAQVKTVDGDLLLAVLAKPGRPPLLCQPPRQPKRTDTRRLRAAAEALSRLIPPAQPFILIDEEHLRATLPNLAAIPFLEKHGQYWGPPPDDATAIAELERLRRTGATHLAVVWSCLWWLEHYAGFHRHLREHFRVIEESEAIIVFDLQRSC